MIGKPTVARIWIGKVRREKADEYQVFLEQRAVPDYKSVEGNLGIIILRRDLEDHSEFTLITLWTDIEAIKKFAGEDYSKAKYYPEDKEYLLDFPSQVDHYTVSYLHFDLESKT